MRGHYDYRAARGHSHAGASATRLHERSATLSIERHVDADAYRSLLREGTARGRRQDAAAAAASAAAAEALSQRLTPARSHSSRRPQRRPHPASAPRESSASSSHVPMLSNNYNDDENDERIGLARTASPAMLPMLPPSSVYLSQAYAAPLSSQGNVPIEMGALTGTVFKSALSFSLHSLTHSHNLSFFFILTHLEHAAKAKLPLPYLYTGIRVLYGYGRIAA